MSVFDDVKTNDVVHNIVYDVYRKFGTRGRNTYWASHCFTTVHVCSILGKLGCMYCTSERLAYYNIIIVAINTRFDSTPILKFHTTHREYNRTGIRFSLLPLILLVFYFFEIQIFFIIRHLRVRNN